MKNKIFATRNPEMSKREKRNMERVRELATQGMVLLHNDGTLPLRDTDRIALYGSGARNTIKGGTGSGDVNSRLVVNVEEGLCESGVTVTTTNWLDRYERVVMDQKNSYFQDVKNRFEIEGSNVFWHILNHPFQAPATIPITQDDLENGKAETAVFVIARNSGEGKDRGLTAGDYELGTEEKEAIQTLIKNYKKVVIVLNTGGVMDTKFLRTTKGINAVLLMGQCGNIGGLALADVLLGKKTPCGHLTATWAESYSDYPGASEFSYLNGNVDDEYYEEGIYVGYRYFDTFGITPAYPFGYGLSYTDFALRTESVEIRDQVIHLRLHVKNTGKQYAGREVIQVYYSAPLGRLEKPYQELAAFAKTKELLPGQSDCVEVSFDVQHMASYDEDSASWILESGIYYIRVGTHSRNTHIVAGVCIEKEIQVEKTRNCFKPDWKPCPLLLKGVSSYSYESETEEKEHALLLHVALQDIHCKENVYQEENTEISHCETDEIITVRDISEGKATINDLIGQLTVDEMASVCVGAARGGIAAESVIGAASRVPGAAGDTCDQLQKKRDLQSIILADGPAGLRLSKMFKADQNGNTIPFSGEAPIPGMEFIMEKLVDHKQLEGAETYYQYCTALPVATQLAQSWDTEVLRTAGDIVGEEMEELGISLWLAPAMNIQRNPLCGRNFEYYSEDPVLSGICAAMETMGVQQHNGAGTTIKHFACNNQEDNRMRINAHISERAIREIYLKGFEIAVKRSQPMAVMTSYNRLNGVCTANSKELLRYILRDEWNFEGIVVTDWGATGSLGEEEGAGHKYEFATPEGCIQAGNDLIMPGSETDVEGIIQAVNTGKVPLADLQACVKRMIRLVMQSMGYADEMKK